MSRPRTADEEFELWEQRRATAFQVAYAFAHLTETLTRAQRNSLFGLLARRTLHCAQCQYVAIVRPPNGDEPYVRIINRSACNSRFCPLCARRLAWRQRQLVNALIDRIYAANPSTVMLMLTGTLRNQPMVECADMFDRIKRAHKNLMAHPRVRLAHLGHWTQFECPPRWNANGDLEAGWHFHAMLATDDTSVLLRWEEWRALFRAAAGVDYEPIIRIERVTERSDDSPHEAALRGSVELAKYICSPRALLQKPKAKDLFDDPDTMEWTVIPEALRHLTLTVRKKRLHRYAGVWAEAMTQHRRGRGNLFESGGDAAASSVPF